MHNDQEMVSVSEWIRVAAAEVCGELFEAYGVSVSLATDTVNGSVDPLFCGAIGFVGEGIRGTCLLAVAQSPLERSKPAEGSLRDWMGELTNQVLGRIKVKLLTRGIRIGISTPVVLRGDHLAPLPRKSLLPAVLNANPGLIVVWVEVDADEGFVLPPETETPPTPESDFVMF